MARQIPVGSFSTYHASTTVSTPGTNNVWTDFNPTWVEDLDRENMTTINGSNIDITEAGRYLILFYIPATETHNSRCLFQTRLRGGASGTTVLEGSGDATYGRNSGNPQMGARGAYIYNAVAGDTIDIQWMDDVGLGTVADTSDVNTTEIQFIKLPEDHAVAYASYTDGTSTISFDGNVAVAAPFDTIDEETDTSVIEQTSSTVVELHKIAKYLVVYSIGVHQTSGNRTVRTSFATLAGTEINGSQSYCFLREANEGFGYDRAMFIVNNTSADQDLIINARAGESTSEVNVNGTIARIVDDSSLCIMELPKQSELYLSHDGTAGQDISNVGDDVPMDLFTNEDFATHSFTKTDADTLTCNQKEGYLVMAAIRSVDNPLSGGLQMYY